MLPIRPRLSRNLQLRLCSSQSRVNGGGDRLWSPRAGLWRLRLSVWPTTCCGCNVVEGFQSLANRGAEHRRSKDEAANERRRSPCGEQDRQQGVERCDVGLVIMRVLHEPELLAEEEFANDVERIPAA
jgi:hypothetical protein